MQWILHIDIKSNGRNEPNTEIQWTGHNLHRQIG